MQAHAESRAPLRLAVAVALALGHPAAGAADFRADRGPVSDTPPPTKRAVLFHGKIHEASEVDGRWLIEGDIVVTPRALPLPGARKSSTLSDLRRWTAEPSGLVNVPYTVESDAEGVVPKAVAEFNRVFIGVIQFVPRTSQANYVAFKLDRVGAGACTSPVGMVGGRQLIDGPPSGCGLPGLLHEMGHAIGLLHEHQRPEQASFLTVGSNIDPSYVSALAAEPTATINPWDYQSIMHYDAGAFSTDGLPVLESIPAGIPFAVSTTFSAGDREAVYRLYATASPVVTVETNPPGLPVEVDGVTVTTPARFSWPLGSRHTLAAPGTPSGNGNTAYQFARWSDDGDRKLGARRSYTVEAVAGPVANTSAAIRSNVLTANYVVYRKATTLINGSGTVAATPLPEPLPGLSGEFWRDRQVLKFSATPAADHVAWAGQNWYSVGSNARPQGTGVVWGYGDGPVQLRAAFASTGRLRVNAVDAEGKDLAGPGVSAGGYYWRLPLASATNLAYFKPGGTVTVQVASPQYDSGRGTRYSFLGWSDGDTLASKTVAVPELGNNLDLAARFKVEVKPPAASKFNCAGSLSFSPAAADGYYAPETSVEAKATPASGWTFAGWSGTASGTTPTQSLTVTATPGTARALADFNLIAEPLTVTGLSRATAEQGEAPFTLDISGTGFTPGMYVYIGSSYHPTRYVSARQAQITVNPEVLASPGGTTLTAYHYTDQPQCWVHASTDFTVKAAAAATLATRPETGWYYNPGESGTGYFVEQQGDKVFAGQFGYDTDGHPTWFVSADAFQGNRVSADRMVFRDGQALTAPYRAPTAQVAGRINYDFVGGTTIGVSSELGAMPLWRFRYAAPGSAATVENGWWLNPSESGRGYAIEVQSGQLFICVFAYDAAGNPRWYLSSGPMQSPTQYRGTWVEYGGGQAFGGTYRTPRITNANVGEVTIDFATPRSGRLTLPDGKVTAIERLQF